MKRPARWVGLGGTTPFLASLSMSYRANMNFRSSPTITGRANMRRPPRSGPISRRSRATVASPNSSASTRRSSQRGSPTVAGTSRPPRATRTLRMSSSAPPDFSTSRSFLTLRDPRVSPARLFTRRAGITLCPMPASAGGSSAAAPVACRSPRRSPGPDATSPSSSAARNGSISVRIRTRAGASV